MTRADLVARLAHKLPQLPLKDTRLGADLIFEAMSAALAGGRRIELRGFGAFTVHCREPRPGRNPSTGQGLVIPAKIAIHFKPGLELQERVDRKGRAFLRTQQHNK